MIKWQILPFESLTISQLYDILQIREEVFTFGWKWCRVLTGGNGAAS